LTANFFCARFLFDIAVNVGFQDHGYGFTLPTRGVLNSYDF